jgi:hypothetical protein
MQQQAREPMRITLHTADLVNAVLAWGGVDEAAPLPTDRFSNRPIAYTLKQGVKRVVYYNAERVLAVMLEAEGSEG